MYTRDLVKTVKMGNPYNFLVDSVFVVVRGVVCGCPRVRGEGCFLLATAAVAQLVERVLGKDEVMGPSPISS